MSPGYHTWTTYSYSKNFSYSWDFDPEGSASKQTGIATVSKLTLGSANEIKGTVKASGTETVTTWTRYDSFIGYTYPTPEPQRPEGMSDEDWNEMYQAWKNTGIPQYSKGNPTSTSTTNTITGTAEDSIIVYTRPGSFTDYNFSADTIIQSPDGLTATKVGNWINHCNKYAHWYNQDAEDVTTATCSATSGSIITAKWYNACANAIPTEGTGPAVANVTGGVNGTIITADIINALGAAISKGDT